MTVAGLFASHECKKESMDIFTLETDWQKCAGRKEGGKGREEKGETIFLVRRHFPFFAGRFFWKNESRRQLETVCGNHLRRHLLEGIGSVRGIDRASFEIPQLLGRACIVNQVIGMVCTAAGPANQKHRSGRDGIHVVGK